MFFSNLYLKVLKETLQYVGATGSVNLKVSHDDNDGINYFLIITYMINIMIRNQGQDEE